MIARVYWSRLKFLTMEQSFTFLSNRLEFLYEGWKKNLFQKGTNPFAKRLVIVPSPAMKSYLKRTMAEDPDLHITFGLEFAFLDQGIELLKHSLSSPELIKKFPSQLELSINIENEIALILREEGDCPKWAPLSQYFASNNHKSTILKLTWLSDELARLFLIYGEYGHLMLKEWEEGREGHWQAEIWRRVYSKKFFPLYQVLTNEFVRESQYQEVHLFGLSFISSVKSLFFKKVSRHIPVYSWYLSPCQRFWSDIRSDRENNKIANYWLQREAPNHNVQALISLLNERNTLLANFGRLGRHMAEMLEELDFHTYSQYGVSKGALSYPSYESAIDDEAVILSCENPFSLLEAIQADLTLQRNSSDKLDIQEECSSVQIHASSSLLRETENIYNTLLKLIQESKEPLEPHDIIVMAPEITQYVPYIDRVFGSQESLLDYQIMDLKLVSKGELSQTLLQFLSLAQSKWKLTEVLKLFSYPPFRQKQEISNEEFFELKNWLENHAVTWGLNESHRNQFLEQEGFSPLLEETEKGTWQDTIDALLISMVLSSSEELEWHFEQPLPRYQLDLSQADLLGKLSRFLKSAAKDLAPLNLKEEKTLPDWEAYFLHLLDTYFAALSYEDAFNEELESVILAINRLHRLGEEVSGASFSADSVLIRLTSLFEAKDYGYREKHFQAVRFSSLLPMRAVPAKVVVLMGLNEDVYPRKERKSSLNMLLKHHQSDYCPTQIDFDRYLFLEALLSARQHFVISYVAKSSANGKKNLPSPLVCEFLEYLDQSFLIKGKIPSSEISYFHPYFAFDQLYFQEEGVLKNFSKSDYRAACAYYQQSKHPHAFLTKFHAPLSQSPNAKEGTVVDLKRLIALAKHPLRSFLNHVLGIYLDGNQGADELDFSTLDRFLLKQQGLKRSLEKVLIHAEKQRLLPFAPFSLLAKEELKDDILKWETALKEFDLSKDNLFDCSFSLSCEQPYRMAPNHLVLPPLEIETSHGLVRLIGKLSHLSSKGLVFFDKKEMAKVVKFHPQWLVFSAIPYDICQKQFLILDKREILAPNGQEKSLLKQFMEYFFLSEKIISPLMPEWISPVLEGCPNKLKKRMEASKEGDFKGFLDPYLQWVFHEEQLPDSQQLIQDWQPLAQTLYGSLKEVWKLR
ncbi:MAG: exodeoxyribonuclease V subunit gamma [Parachlamydiaceae bacterium]